MIPASIQAHPWDHHLHIWSEGWSRSYAGTQPKSKEHDRSDILFINTVRNFIIINISTYSTKSIYKPPKMFRLLRSLANRFLNVKILYLSFILCPSYTSALVSSPLFLYQYNIPKESIPNINNLEEIKVKLLVINHMLISFEIWLLSKKDKVLTLMRPLALSSSYLTLLPLLISMTCSR